MPRRIATEVNNLRELRKSRCITQEDMANMLGIDRRYLSSIENHRNNLSLEKAIEASKFFGVTLDEIYGKKELEDASLEQVDARQNIDSLKSENVGVFVKEPVFDVKYLSVENLELISPKLAGIYFLYDDEKVLMYVGQTSALRERVQSHLKPKSYNVLKDLIHNFKYVSYFICENPVERDIYETYLINKMKPKLNIEKVLTYKSERYSKKYNPVYFELKRELAERLPWHVEEFERMKREAEVES